MKLMVCVEITDSSSLTKTTSDGRSDLLKKNYLMLNSIQKQPKLKTLFEKMIFLCHLISTALIEAALKSKICVQLKVFNIPTDDFEKSDICRSFTSLSEFDQFFKRF